MKTLSVLVLILFVGCSTPTIKVDKPLPQSLQEVRLEFNKLDKDDQDLVYKQFAGSAEYLKKAKLTSTSQFDPILGRVQSSYSWDRDKYPQFTSEVSDFLIEKGYDVPKTLDSKENQEWFQQIFEDLANACK